MRLGGKVAIVTGSTKGMGRATAELFAREGAKVVVTGRDRAAGDAIVEGIRATAGVAIFQAADIGDELEVESLVDRAVSEFGAVDVLVNNASPTHITRGKGKLDDNLADMSLSAWNEVFSGSSIGFFLASKYAIKAMVSGGKGGAIVNISSAMAARGFAGSAAYPAAKGAVNALTQALAASYGSVGIRANAIVVGVIVTSADAEAVANDPDLGPAFLKAQLVKRWGHPDDVARGSLYLASDESSFVTGSQLFIDGGISCKTSLPF